MRTLLSLCARFVVFGAVALCLTASTISLADVPAKVNDQATQLVQKALVAEAAGKPDDRANILQQALQIAPDFAPAHWQMGEVHADGKWTSIDDAAKLDSHSAKMDEYRQLREQAAPTVDGQLDLARWCEKAGLKDQQRAHLMFALEMQPNNKEAISKLGLVRFQRRLVPADQLDEIKAKLQDSRDESKEWKAKIDDWHAQLQKNPHDPEVLKQIRAVRDTGALHFISKELANSGEDACLAIIDATAEMHQQWATETLLRAALYSPYQEVSNRAIYALKSRPVFDYVPLLIEKLKAPIRVEYDVLNYDVNNFTQHLRLSRQAFDHEDVKIDYASVTNTSPVLQRGSGSLSTNPGPDSSVFRTEEAAIQLHRQAQATVNRVEQINQQAADNNATLVKLLQATTGQELGDNPEAWWDWWYDYNDYYHATETPVRLTTNANNSYAISPRLQRLYNPPPPPPPPPPGGYRSSCFPAGTPIWTTSGPMQIEKIKVGELVLAQNTETGELAYKPVIGTTIRPPVATMQIHLRDRLIRATRGHPFWVSGKGWQMAKELQAGDWLHTVHGGVLIDAVEPSEEAICYNLVVADYHDYFVGDAKVLVHDNLLRSPTVATVPGLAEAQ